MHTWLTRVCLTAGTVAVTGLLASGTAIAHVTADSPGAVQGGYTVITFRVPTESPTATTTGLTVALPAQPGAQALSSVRTAPLPGWTAKVAKDPATAAPTAITWTAQPGNALGPDQFGQFEISVGPLPRTPTVSFPTIQRYSDGSVVKWDEPPKADGSEPEHPVPTLTLAAAGSAPTPSNVASATEAPVAAAAGAGSDTTARWLGGIGLLLAALSLGLAGGVALRDRRTT